MKNYEVHRIYKDFSKKNSEELAKESQDFINKKINEGFELISTHFGSNDVYIYSFMVFKR